LERLSFHQLMKSPIFFTLFLASGLLSLPLPAQNSNPPSAEAASPATVLIPANPVPSATPSATPPEQTPLSIPGSEPFVFRTIGETELRLHVVKPKGWTASAKLPCLVSFFGGGWTHGTPAHSIEWARWAAEHGMVGVAPDYRTSERYKGTPEDCVSDARAAVRWVQSHAAELGVDSSRIICAGGSAGGHVAAWTAIPGKGPGADDPGAPDPLPVALVLFNPVTDTKDSGYGGAKRFGGSAERALACSVPDQMPAKMPPTIVFHATADQVVHYKNSTDFRDKLVAAGNQCELITFEGLGHSYYSKKYGAEGAAAKVKTEEEMGKFLGSLGLIKSDTSTNSSAAK
jgi:acetyl esterase